MNKFTLVLFVFLCFINCKEQNNRNTIPDKIEFTERNEEEYRTKINDFYQSEVSKCSNKINTVTDYNGKKEFWRICETENNNRIIKIESYQDDKLYEEVHFEQNSELIYAEESEIYIPINHYDLQTWNCQFYIEKGKLVTLISLGMGKTEDENWNPKTIFTMYKNRLNELSKIKTN